jgi:transposase
MAGMSVAPQPSCEELGARNTALAGLVAAQQEQIELLLGQVETLAARVADLEAQLKSNSRNSSRPPSADSPFVKPAPKSLRGKTGRKPGGQAGHRGQTLRQVADPHRRVTYRARACGRCGAAVAGAAVSRVEARQVFDIPKVEVQVTEHRILTVRCACGHETTADAPEGVNTPVAYGPNATAFAAYLYAGQFLSKQRTAQVLEELFGTPLSGATVSAMTKRCAQAVRASGVLERIRQALRAALVVNFDETGLRVAGRLHWVHSASTAAYSLITVHPRRGVEGMKHAGVLPDFHGIAVHDAWAPYDTFTQAEHALCNAHVIRELIAVFDEVPAQEWCWARQAHDALLNLKKLVDQAITEKRRSLSADQSAPHIRLLRSAAGIGAHIRGGGRLGAKHRALARRLLDRQGDYLRFLNDGFAVPWDNNAAEREIRMVKLRQKVSGSMRTLTGAHDFTDLRSYLATAAKHGIRFIDALTTLAEHQPWLPTTA